MPLGTVILQVRLVSTKKKSAISTDFGSLVGISFLGVRYHSPVYPDVYLPMLLEGSSNAMPPSIGSARETRSFVERFGFSLGIFGAPDFFCSL